ncbi:MAG: MFS transporter, partial [Planctomycetaceae bacterium]|nr:MFS transporter [Planctomycetaceae bacterium]
MTAPFGAERFVYGRRFWLAYTSNTLLLVAVALLFRYADFVHMVGGTEFNLGWIVGIGTFGSLFTRILIGNWLDRYGTRVLWIASALLFSAACFAHLCIHSPTGVGIYLLRILYCCAVAGANGASMTFISKCGPKERLAELVGMLGTAGFLGWMGGALLGDLLLGSLSVGRTHVVAMFLVAGLLGLCS